MAGCVIRGAGKANEQLSGYGDLATAAYQAIGDQGQGQEPKIVFVHHFFLVLYKRAKSGHSNWVARAPNLSQRRLLYPPLHNESLYRVQTDLRLIVSNGLTRKSGLHSYVDGFPHKKKKV
jgi:hypothetical protein